MAINHTRESLESHGIKVYNKYGSPLGIPFLPSPKTDWNNAPLNPIQSAFLGDSNSSLDLGIWRYVNASTFSGVNPQQTISNFASIDRKKANLALFDIETLGVDTEDFVQPTEFSFRFYKGINPSYLGERADKIGQGVNILVNPDEALPKIKTMVEKVKAGMELKPGERTALVHLLRYGKGLEAKDGIISSYSDLYNNDTLNKLMNSSDSLKDLVPQFDESLKNLQLYGMSEKDARIEVKKQLSRIKNVKLKEQYALIGHNVNKFDIAVTKKWLGDGAEELFKGIKVVDTLDLLKATSSDVTDFYSEFLNKRSIGEFKDGLLTVDSLRKLYGITSEGAHIGSVDVTHEAQIFGKMWSHLDELLRIGKINSMNEAFPNFEKLTQLRYDSSSMRDKDIFFASRATKGSGLDFSIYDGSTESIYGDYPINRGFFYEFKGFSQQGDHFAARFRSEELGTTAYLVAETKEDLAQKIHGSGLLPWDLKTNHPFRQEIVGSRTEDYGRRTFAKMFEVSSEGYHGVELAERLLGISSKAKTSPSLYRDYGFMLDRLQSEEKYLRRFIEATKDVKMTTEQRNVAFSRFYHRFNEEVGIPTSSSRTPFPFEDTGIDLLDLRADSHQTKVMLSDRDTYSKRINTIINRNIVVKSGEEEVRRAGRSSYMRKMLADLNYRKILTPAETEGILSAGSVNYQIDALRGMLLQKADINLKETIFDSMSARDINISDDALEDLINESVGWVQDLLNVEKSLDLFPTPESKEAYKGFLSTLDESLPGNFSYTPIKKHDGTVSVGIFDMNQTGSVMGALTKGQIPTNVAYIDVPTLDKAGDIKYGALHRVSQNRLTPTGSVTPHDDILQGVRKNLNILKSRIRKDDSLSTSHEVARSVKRGILDSLTNISGISRGLDPNEEAFDLRVRGTGSDSLKRKEMSITGLVAEVLPEKAAAFSKKHGKNITFDDLFPLDKLEFIENVQGYLRSNEKYKGMNFTFSGVKDVSVVNRGMISTIDPSSMIPFGEYIHGRRPNIIQYQNYYPQSYERLSRIIEGANPGGKPIKGMSVNPLLVTESGLEVFKEQGADFLPGVSMRGIMVTPSDLEEMVARAKEKNPNLQIDSVDMITTWDNQMVMPSEHRGLLVGEQRKTIAIDSRDKVVLSQKIEKILSGEATADDYLLFEDQALGYRYDKDGGIVNRIAFKDKRGRIDEIRKVGHEYLIDTTSIFPFDNAVKVSPDSRKGTINFADVFRELVPDEDIHFMMMATPGKHDDIGVDMAQQVRHAADQFKGTEELREEFSSKLQKYLGIKSNWEQLPGREEYTAKIPEKIAPGFLLHDEKGEFGFNPLMESLGVETSREIQGKRYSVFTADIRRAYVDERRRFATWEGDGLEKGYGVKYGPREVLSLNTTAIRHGVDLDPVLDWARERTEGSSTFKRGVAAFHDQKKVLTSLVSDDVMSNLPTKHVRDFESLPKVFGEDFFDQDDLSGTIFDLDGVVGLELPEGIEVNIGDSTKRINRLPVGRQLIKPDEQGRIWLSRDENRSLRSLFGDLQDYNRVGSIRTKEEIVESITRNTNKYISSIAKEMTSSHGYFVEDALTGKLPSSGYFSAQALANTDTLGGGTNVAVMPFEKARKIFGEEMAERMLVEGTEGNPHYTFLMRHPNTSSESLQVVKTFVDPRLRGDEVRIDPITAAKNLGDQDGDTYAIFSPWDKHMSMEDYDFLQETMGNLHTAQDKENRKIVSAIYSKIHGKSYSAIDEQGRFTGHFLEYMQDPDKKEMLMKLVDSSYMEGEVIKAKVGKSATGLLFNPTQKARGFAAVMYEQEPEKMTLIGHMARTAAEQVSIKSKDGTVLVRDNIELVHAINRGNRKELLSSSKYIDMFASVLPEEVTFQYEDARHIVSMPTGAERTLALEKANKSIATKIMTQFVHLREELRQGASEDYWNSPAANLFISERVSSRGVSASAEALNTANHQAPTHITKMVNRVLGEPDGFSEVLDKFKSNVNQTRIERNTPVSGMAPGIGTTTTTKKNVASSILRGINASKKNMAIGAGVGLGLYALSSLVRKPFEGGQKQKEPTPVVGNPDGMNISIKGKDRNNSDMNVISSLVNQAVQETGASNGQVDMSLNIRDNTRGVDNEWISELFSKAIK